MKELENIFKSKSFNGVYLLFGEENYLKRYYEEKFRQEILEESSRIMNMDIFEGKSLEAQNIIDSVSTAPFISEYRLVLVKASGFFNAGKKEDTDKLSDFINKLPEFSILLFIEDTVDKRNKLYKTISKVGLAVELNTPKEPEIIKWVTNFFIVKDKLISKDCVIKFIRTVPYDLDTIFFEADKLINYKGKHKKITEEDINTVCTKSLEIKIFDLVKAVGEKKLEKSLDIYNNLIVMKEQPLMILAMLTRQFRLILQCKSLSLKGYSLNEIADKLEVRSFVVKECLNQGKNFKFNTLLKGLNESLETDINIKTGRLNDKLAVEVFIIKYSNIN